MTMSQMKGEKMKAEFFKRAKPFFAGLSFEEESHSYFVYDRKIPISVSGIVKNFENKPDWDAIAQRIAYRDGITKEEVLAAWKDKNKTACDNGTKTHNFGENYTGKETPKEIKEAGIVKFYNDLPERYYPIAKEQRMYHKELGFSGTCDKIFYDLIADKFIISDWKTNESLFKNFKSKTLLSPFEDLLDNPYNFYQIQLSLYQMLFEQLGFKISERWVVWLLPDGTYNRYQSENFTHKLYKHLKAA